MKQILKTFIKKVPHILRTNLKKPTYQVGEKVPYYGKDVWIVAIRREHGLEPMIYYMLHGIECWFSEDLIRFYKTDWEHYKAHCIALAYNNTQVE